MVHQAKAVDSLKHLNESALFLSVGTGKTYCTINLAEIWFDKNDIDQIVVIVPNGIKLVWKAEFAKFYEKGYILHNLTAGKYSAFSTFMNLKTMDLKVLLVSVESLSQGKQWELAHKFARSGKTYTIVDESISIKGHKSKRTERATIIGGASEKRSILTGSIISQGYEDLYGQFMFLNESILGFRSYFAFRARYCRMGGFNAKQIVGYYNEDDLVDKIKPYVYQISDEEKVKLLDLPPQIFETIEVDPSKQQLKAINELKAIMETSHEDGEVLEVGSILEATTRYNQILSGIFPFKEEEESKKYSTKAIDGPNPKLEALKTLVNDVIPSHNKVIIFCRFRPEIDMVISALPEGSYAEFHGGVNSEQREKNVIDFQNPKSKIRFFVATLQAGARGLTLTEAKYMIRFSKTFSFDDDYQSSGRNYRKGTEHDKVVYYSIVSNHPADLAVAMAIEKKKGYADFVTESLKSGDTNFMEQFKQ